MDRRVVRHFRATKTATLAACGYDSLAPYAEPWTARSAAVTCAHCCRSEMWIAAVDRADAREDREAARAVRRREVRRLTATVEAFDAAVVAALPPEYAAREAASREAARPETVRILRNRAKGGR